MTAPDAPLMPVEEFARGIGSVMSVAPYIERSGLADKLTAAYRRVIAEVERLTKVEGDFKLLCRAVNDDAPDDACTGKCDSYGHSDDCKTGNMAEAVIKLRSEVERLTKDWATTEAALLREYKRSMALMGENDSRRSEVERVTKERLTEWEANALLHLMNDTPESPSYDRLTEKLEAISRGAVRGDAAIREDAPTMEATHEHRCMWYDRIYGCDHPSIKHVCKCGATHNDENASDTWVPPTAHPDPVQPPADREPPDEDLFGNLLSAYGRTMYDRGTLGEPLKRIGLYEEVMNEWRKVASRRPAPADEQEFEKALDALELTLRVIGLDRKTAAKQRAARTEVMRLYRGKGLTGYDSSR